MEAEAAGTDIVVMNEAIFSRGSISLVMCGGVGADRGVPAFRCQGQLRHGGMRHKIRHTYQMERKCTAVQAGKSPDRSASASARERLSGSAAPPNVIAIGATGGRCPSYRSTSVTDLGLGPSCFEYERLGGK